MKIRFIKSPTPLGLAYFEGEEGDLPEPLCQELIADKYAISVTATVPELEPEKLPKNTELETVEKKPDTKQKPENKK